MKCLHLQYSFSTATGDFFNIWKSIWLVQLVACCLRILRVPVKAREWDCLLDVTAMGDTMVGSWVDPADVRPSNTKLEEGWNQKLTLR